MHKPAVELEHYVCSEVPGPTKVWRAAWMLAAAVAMVFVILMLVVPHRSHALSRQRYRVYTTTTDAVLATGRGRIAVRPDSTLAKNLTRLPVQKSTVTYPLLTVTGSVVARIRPGQEPLEDRWQFASADLSTVYADWLIARADVEFNEKQLAATRELIHAQHERFRSIVDRLQSLAPAGSVPRKDLLTAEADLVQSELQGQKDLYSAESALRTSLRQRAALERQLMQAGIEPDVLSRAREHMVLISANVPEAKMSLVKQGQSCQARFYGFPTEMYSAHVEELGSIVTTEHRTLRVLFDLSDPANELRPGMFAEVGLGTDPREALTVPASAVLHMGRSDYVFRQVGQGFDFEVVEVKVGESHGDQLEIVAGLEPGSQIVGNEAVLLKPVAVQSLEM
jgi:hypothetical protein